MEKVIESPQLVETGCGLEVHKDIIVVTISRGNQSFETREYVAGTSSLTSLRDWCKQAGVTHVAIESRRGQCWGENHRCDYFLGA